MSSRAADAAARGTRVAALPNLLTLLRVGLAPVLVVALLWPTPAARAVAALACRARPSTDALAAAQTASRIVIHDTGGVPSGQSRRAARVSGA